MQPKNTDVDLPAGAMPGEEHAPRYSGSHAAYDRECDEYYAARKALGTQLLAAAPNTLLEWLTREPMNLRNRVGLTVQWGLARNLVAFDFDTGLARARQDFEDVAPEALRAWAEGIEDVDELRDAYEQSGPVFGTHAEHRTFADLEYALTTGYGQSIVLRHVEKVAAAMNDGGSAEAAFNQLLVDVSEGGQAYAASSLLPAVAMIAEEVVPRGVGVVPKTRRVSLPVWNEVAPLLAAMQQNLNGTISNQPPWVVALVHRFEAPLRGETAEEVVGDLLELLGYFGEAPEVFARKARAHVSLAEAFIRKAQIRTEKLGDDDSGPIYVPEQRSRGRPMSPMKAAAEFARCFGYTIPDRARDATRWKGGFSAENPPK